MKKTPKKKRERESSPKYLNKQKTLYGLVPYRVFYVMRFYYTP